jgi:hypothetical protein
MRNYIICGTKRNELGNGKLRIAARKDASLPATGPAAWSSITRSMRPTQGRYQAFVQRFCQLCVTGAARDLRSAIDSLAWTASHACWQPESHRVQHAFLSRS